jgi:hypothetical protein
LSLVAMVLTIVWSSNFAFDNPHHVGVGEARAATYRFRS